MKIRGLPSKEFIEKPPFISIYTPRDTHIRVGKMLVEKIKKLLENNLKLLGRKALFDLRAESFESAKNIMFHTLFVSLNAEGEIFLSGFPVESNTDSVFLGNFPKVEILLKHLVYFEKMLVCIIEKSRLKCFELELEGIKEVGWLDEEVPKKVKYGGLLGFEENRIRRHVEHHELMFLEKSALFVKEILTEKKLKTLAVGCRNEFREEVEKTYQKLLNGFNVFYFEASINDLNQNLTQKVLKEYKSLKEKKKEEMMKSPRMVAVELPKLIELFNLKKLNTAIVNFSNSSSCYYCPKDLTISLKEKECEICGREMFEHDNVHEILSLALLINGKNVYFDEDIEKTLVEPAF